MLKAQKVSEKFQHGRWQIWHDDLFKSLLPYFRFLFPHHNFICFPHAQIDVLPVYLTAHVCRGFTQLCGLQHQR